MSLDYSATRIEDPGEAKTGARLDLKVETALQDLNPKRVRCKFSPISCSTSLSPLCIPVGRLEKESFDFVD